jgi:hypothetical protein
MKSAVNSIGIVNQAADRRKTSASGINIIKYRLLCDQCSVYSITKR